MRFTMITLTMALAALTLSAPPCEAQFLQPPGGELGISYQLTGDTPGGRVDGVGFHYDTPRFGPITLAANGTFSRQSGYGGQRTVYFGAGPGVRFNFEQMTFFGHFLLGGEVGVGTRMGRDATAAAFKPRGGLGMSYRLTRNVRLRGGLDFDTHPHVLAGVGLRF